MLGVIQRWEMHGEWRDGGMRHTKTEPKVLLLLQEKSKRFFLSTHKEQVCISGQSPFLWKAVFVLL